jgi:hypothetical protein
MRLRVAPLAIASLVALCCVDAWFAKMIFDETASPDTLPEAKYQSHPNLPPTPAPPKPRTIDSHTQVLLHPLFLKAREPFVPPPPPPPPQVPQVVMPAPPPADPGLVLGGITISGDLRKVYLISKANANSAWVSEGESYMGWKVQSVSSSGTTLQQSNRTLQLELYTNGGGQPQR